MRKFVMVVLLAVGCLFAGTVDSTKMHNEPTKIVRPAVRDTVVDKVKIKYDSLKVKVDSILKCKKSSVDSAKATAKIAVDSRHKSAKAKRDSLVNTIKDVKTKAAVRARIDTVEARHYRLRDKIEAKKELIKSKQTK
jgi:hypothetical protein